MTVTHEDYPVYSCINDLLRGWNGRYTQSVNRTFDNSTEFKHALNINISGDSVEIPMLFGRDISAYYYRSITNLTNKKSVVIPLYTNCANQVRRTSRTILNQFFNIMSDTARLVKITTSKGDVYYGGKGIILDGNFKPLLMLTIKTEKTENAINYSRLICHVSPLIFEKQDEMFIKYIIKKVFPVLTKYEFSFPSYPYSSQSENKKFKIVIDNFDDFFIEPVKPKPEDIVSDKFNQTLVDNVDEIIAELCN